MGKAADIIQNAFDLISGDSITDTGFSDVGFTIPTGFSNNVNYSAPLIGGPGARPSIFVGDPGAVSRLTSMSATIPGDPSLPVFKTISESVQISDLDVPVAPMFLTAVVHPDVPTDGFDRPPTNLPQFSGVTLGGDAGLSPPDTPTIEAGKRPKLDTINTNVFEPIKLTLFEKELPEYENVEFEPIEYETPENYDADASLLAAMAEALTTGNILPEVIQAAMVQEQTADLIREQERTIHKIKAETASKGFFLPTGAATEQQLLVIEKTLREREKVSAEVMNTTLDRGKQTLVEAAQNGLALEAKHLELHLAYIEHLMQHRRFNVKMAANVLSLLVKLYNAKIALIKPHINAYNAYVDAVQKQNTAPQILAQMQQAYVKGLNDETNMYEAQLDVTAVAHELNSLAYEPILNEIKEYVANTKGVAENVQRLQMSINAYEAAVKAYNQRVEYDILRASANREEYKNWALGEGLASAQHRTNSAYIQAVASRAQQYKGVVGTAAQTISQATQAYGRYTSSLQSYLSAFTDKLSAASTILSSANSAVGAGLQLASAQTKVDASVTAVKNQQELANAEQNTRQQVLHALDTAHDETIRANQLASQAKAAAGIAQAAYGIFGAGYSVSGVATANDDGVWQSYTSYSENAQRVYRETRRHDSVD